MHRKLLAAWSPPALRQLSITGLKYWANCLDCLIELLKATARLAGWGSAVKSTPAAPRLPKPFQQPTPPFWVAAGSDDAIDWSAERGYSILLDPHSPHRTILGKKQRFLAGLERHGYETTGRVLPTARLLAVAGTDVEAEEIARQGAQWTLGSYANEKTSGRIPVIAQNTEQADPVKRYVDEVIIHGSPAKVRDQLVELRETTDLDYLMCAPLGHDTFMRFTNSVLPALL